jgi:hypothetical protein
MKRMSAVEFCLVMAITMEQAESMPSFGEWEGNYVLPRGLCSVITRGNRYGLISLRTMTQLDHTLYRLRPKESDAYFWGQHQWEPRAKHLRRMARYLARKG